MALPIRKSCRQKNADFFLYPKLIRRFMVTISPNYIRNACFFPAVDPYHLWSVAQISNLMSITFYYNPVLDLYIMPNFCTWHDSYTVLPCAKIWSDTSHRISLSANWKTDYECQIWSEMVLRIHCDYLFMGYGSMLQWLCKAINHRWDTNQTTNQRARTFWGQIQDGRQKQTTVSTAFLSMKMMKFWLKFHWSLFLGMKLIIIQCWFVLVCYVYGTK